MDARIGDVTDRQFLQSVFKEVQVVFHLAALFNNPESSWDDYYRVNVTGTQTVLRVAKECEVLRVVHCSTVGVSAGDGIHASSEDAPYSPPENDKYEKTKCEGEKVALEFHRREGLPVVVIRPAQVYGPGDTR
jgi:nucleoside-diphosphate-sugar epimerase